MTIYVTNYFDTLPEDLKEMIFEMNHKSCMKEVHEELLEVFRNYQNLSCTSFYHYSFSNHFRNEHPEMDENILVDYAFQKYGMHIGSTYQVEPKNRTPPLKLFLIGVRSPEIRNYQWKCESCRDETVRNISKMYVQYKFQYDVPHALLRENSRTVSDIEWFYRYRVPWCRFSNPRLYTYYLNNKEQLYHTFRCIQTYYLYVRTKIILGWKDHLLKFLKNFTEYLLQYQNEGVLTIEKCRFNEVETLVHKYLPYKKDTESEEIINQIQFSLSKNSFRKLINFNYTCIL
jgi:hypothetical protein